MASKFFNIDDVYDLVKHDLRKELSERGLPSVDKKKFRLMVKSYFRHLFNCVIYKHQSIEFWREKGFFEGNKILCTEFNPKPWTIDLMKMTGGYFYFINWIKPEKYWGKVKLKPNHWWKRKMWEHVKTGVDYPEMINGRYEDVYGR